MIEPFEHNPRRLAEEDSELGSLLRTVLDQPAHPPDEARNWHGLCARRVARRQRSRVLGAGLALTLVAGLVWAASQQTPDTLHIHREPVAAGEAEPANPVPAVSARSNPVTEAQPAQPRPVPAVAATPAAPASAASRSATDTSECVGRVRAADYAGAVACYDTIAKGNGVGAELALYEKARLQARALGNPSAALETLQLHQQRFGRGSLATEVAVTRIELLAGAGRSADALAAIDRALAGGVGRERAGDLHALRGDLLRGAGDCRGALAEYAAAESGGVHSARLARGRQLCGGTGSAPPPASAEVQTADGGGRVGPPTAAVPSPGAPTAEEEGSDRRGAEEP